MQQLLLPLIGVISNLTMSGTRVFLGSFRHKELDLRQSTDSVMLGITLCVTMEG